MTDPFVRLESPHLTGQAVADGNEIQASLSGTADALAEPEIRKFLATLAEQALSRGARAVTMDLGLLEFMNSRCLKAFVTWISSVATEPPDRRYAIRFRTAPDMYWQSRTLRALRTFAPGVVTLI